MHGRLPPGNRSEIASRTGGRKKLEEHLPLLLDHIRAIVEPRSQADPTLRSARIYTPLTAEEVRQRLRTQFDYKEAQLPCVRTLRTKLNALGYQLRKVKKCRPRRVAVLAIHFGTSKSPK